MISSRIPARWLGGLVALLLAIVPVVGSTTTLIGRTVQIEGETYLSPQFGYMVEWGEQWAGLDRHVVSEEGDRDEMMLSNNDGRLWVIGFPAEVEKGDALLAMMDRFTGRASEVVITGMDNAADLPHADVTADRDRISIEVQPVEDATVAIVLMAREGDFDDALAAAQEDVFLNDGAILVQEPVPAVPSGVPATEEPEPTEEPQETEEPEETQVPTEEPDETEVPTEEPEATEEPEPTEEPGGSGETWESDQFGVSLDLPAGWTILDDTSGNGTDTVVVSNGTSTITLHATSEYSGDLGGCIPYARSLVEDDPAYDSLRLQSTASGEPYRGSDDRSSYALFSYTGEDDVEMAWYVRCQYIEEGESVLILMQDVPQADYQNQRSARAAVLNSIDLP